MTIQVGDLVLIARASKKWNRDHAMLGMVGVVTEFTEVGDERVPHFQGIELDGRGRGAGHVDLACLELCTDPQWVHAKELYDERLKKEEEERDQWGAYCRKQQAQVDRVEARATEITAEKLGMTPEAVRKVFETHVESVKTSWAQLEEKRMRTPEEVRVR